MQKRLPKGPSVLARVMKVLVLALRAWMRRYHPNAHAKGVVATRKTDEVTRGATWAGGAATHVKLGTEMVVVRAIENLFSMRRMLLQTRLEKVVSPQLRSCLPISILFPGQFYSLPLPLFCSFLGV
jgi:hypothetical protein